jgi:hypothetical protein
MTVSLYSLHHVVNASIAPGATVGAVTMQSQTPLQVATSTLRQSAADLGPAYRRSTLEENGDGIFAVRAPKPALGWAAYFVELTFLSGGSFPLASAGITHNTTARTDHKIGPLSIIPSQN